jgi:hypothetical protein
MTRSHEVWHDTIAYHKRNLVHLSLNVEQFLENRCNPVYFCSAYSVRLKKVQGSIVKAQCGNPQLIRFLQEKLKLSTNAIAIALRHCEQDPGPLPMILWQYGLVSLEELDQIFDWLES